MGCSRCRRDPMFDPMHDHDHYDNRGGYMPYPPMHMHHRRRREFSDTDEFRRRRRGRAVIIGFPRFF